VALSALFLIFPCVQLLFFQLHFKLKSRGCPFIAVASLLILTLLITFFSGFLVDQSKRFTSGSKKKNQSDLFGPHFTSIVGNFVDIGCRCRQELEWTAMGVAVGSFTQI
jgi:hypothetical protein